MASAPSLQDRNLCQKRSKNKSSLAQMGGDNKSRLKSEPMSRPRMLEPEIKKLNYEESIFRGVSPVFDGNFSGCFYPVHLPLKSIQGRRKRGKHPLDYPLRK